jgi:hypothetical protein
MEDKKQYNFGAYKFATVNLPKIYENLTKSYVTYGGDNLFPTFIIDLFNKSAINRRCITSKAEALDGHGLQTNDTSYDYLLNFANPYESWDEIHEKIDLDYSIFGGFALNLIWSADKKSISEVYHLDFSKVRSGKLNEDDQVNEYWYSYDWSNIRKYKPQSFPAFCDMNKLDENIELSQILYVKDYNPNQTFYPLPSYIGAFNDIQLDINISTFHNSQLINGLTPNLWINFPGGDPSNEIKQKLYDDINSAFSGAENAGRFFMTFSDGSDNAPAITPLQLQNDNYYMNLEERITSRILSAHGISSPLLLGLRVGSNGLGSNADEINISYKHYIETVIKPMEKSILKAINRIFKLNGYDINISVKRTQLLNN